MTELKIKQQHTHSVMWCSLIKYYAAFNIYSTEDMNSYSCNDHFFNTIIIVSFYYLKMIKLFFS